MKKLLSYKDYFNKVYGCFIGKTVIGTLGAPFEGIKMPLDLAFSPDMINTMLPNDDLDLQILWLDVVEKHGEDFTSYDLLRAFCECCHYDPGEYAIMRKNYKRGIYPPLSGKFSNDFYINGMGCPIRSEIWACLYPLDPKKAADISERDGVLDHAGDSVYGERFFAALESAAFEERNIKTLIEIGLKEVPEVCRFRELVSDTVALCDKYKDEKVVLRKILFKYGHPDCTNLYENIAITLIALLLGDGDMIKTGMMALNCGFDTDCTCATAGAVLGLIMGADKIIEQYGWDNIRYDLGVDSVRRSNTVRDLSEDIAILGAYLNKTVEGAPEAEYKFSPSQYPLEFRIDYEDDDPTLSPAKDCVFTLTVKNVSESALSADLSLDGELLSDKKSVRLDSLESVTFGYRVSFPKDKKTVSDKNIITVSYIYGGEKNEYSFGIVGSMPWKVIGPIWKTDPICTTESLINASLKYSNIIKAVEYDGCRSDISRRFHLNFAVDTDTEYMTWDECFVPYNEECVNTKYEETVYYQKQDTIRLKDIMGFKGPCAVYLAREVISPDDKTVCMQIGNSAPFTLWLNGEKITERKTCDTWDAENVHLENIKLKKGKNRLLLRITQVNEDTTYNVFFSNRRSCGEHYVDLSATRPEFFE